MPVGSIGIGREGQNIFPGSVKATPSVDGNYSWGMCRRCNEEVLTMDFVFPTTNVGNTGYGDKKQLDMTGTESVLQIVRDILLEFNWQEDALNRSKKSYHTAHESLGRSLEGKSTEMIMEAVANGDER